MIRGGRRVPRRALLVSALVLSAGLLPPGYHPLASLPVALLALLVAIDLFRAPDRPVSASWTWLPVSVACGIAAASTCMALQPLRSLRLISLWLAAALACIAARSIPRGRGWAAVVASIVLVASIQSGIGIWQSTVSFPSAARIPGGSSGEAEAAPGAAREDDVRRAAVAARVRSGRAVGLLGLPALLASVEILALPVAAAAALTVRGPLRYLSGAAALLIAAGLAATRSLGGAASLALAAAACSTWWGGMAAAHRRAILGALVLIAVAAGVPRLVSPGEQSVGRALSLRAGNWASALGMLADHPAAGVGPGNYGTAYPAHRQAGSNESRHAHNSLLEILSDNGVAMVVPLVLLVIGFLGTIARSSVADDDPPWRWVRRALAVGALAWGVQNLVDFSAYAGGSVIPALALAGLLAARGRGATPTGVAGAPPALSWGSLAAGAVAVAAVAAAALSLPDALSQWNLERAADAAREGEKDGALRLARRAAAWNPWEAEARVAVAHALLDRLGSGLLSAEERAAAIEESLREAAGAVRLDPLTANRRMTLVRARTEAGDVAGAFAAASMAARLNSFRPDYAASRDALEAALRGPGGAAP